MSREVVGKRIQALRTMKSLTQEELARRLGVSRQAVNTWEKGKVRIPKARREMLAAFFGIDAACLDELVAEVVYEESFPLVAREQENRMETTAMSMKIAQVNADREKMEDRMGISHVKDFADGFAQIRELLSEASKIKNPLELEMIGNMLGWAKQKIDEQAANLTKRKKRGRG